MPSSDSPRPRPRPLKLKRGESRAVGWFVVGANAVMGGGIAVLAADAILVPAEHPEPAAPWIATFLLGVSWAVIMPLGYWRMYLHRPPLDGQRAVVEVVDGRPALVLHWTRHLVLMPTLFVTSLVLGATAVGVGVQVSEGLEGAQFVFGFAALMALMLPDSYAKLGRRHCLILDAGGLTARGWDGDAFLAWEDVADVMLKDAGQWYNVRFLGRPGAPSYTWRRARPRFLLLFKPRTPYVEAPAPALDVSPLRLMDAVMLYAGYPAQRHELTDGIARRRLLGEIPISPSSPRHS